MSYENKEPFLDKGTPDPNLEASKGTTFAERLRLALEHRGKGIRQVSKETGISYGAMQKYLSGSANPKLDNLIQLAESTGVDIGWLAVGSSPTEVSQPLQAHSPLEIINNVLSTLEAGEQELLAKVLARKGAETFLKMLDGDNFKFSQLDTDEKVRLLALHAAKKGASADSEINEQVAPTHKQAG
ncbi:helix-turn-helix domain-containing protein [Erwinia psidii]|uniref:helix-turn-helix domain-containing protein n=1 Tax=Erwinia psidii TaxID=69224 RepID=UPI00226B0497|nr:helix-turn-helix domain-containing protein [Erwinia psidii]